MGIAIAEEHLTLAGVARSFLGDRQVLGEARAALDAPAETLPTFWAELASLGWFGLHLSEAHGGSGYGLAELGIVVEELGRVVAPGPFLSTVLASAVLADVCGPAAKDDLLPALADGSRVAAVGLTGALRLAGGVVAGDAGVVLGAPLADVLLLAAGEDVVVVDRNQRGVAVEPSTSLDRGRRVGRVRLTGCTVDSGRVLRGARVRALQIGRALAAAEAAGGAAACTEASSSYARDRIAFGRPIGQFQAVKHHCANMLAQSEMAIAAAWGALRAAEDPRDSSLPTAVAAAISLPAFLYCSRMNIQVHGGIGFTWDHDAHLFLRRAMSLIALFGPIEDARESVVRTALAGARPEARLRLPSQAEALRAEVRAFRDRYESLPGAARQAELLDSGYLVPHWPVPWGRGAGPAEQVVIDEELAGIPRRPGGGWIALTLASVGSPDQQSRWIRPALEGTLSICQLFSEPDAGSDLASITTRAERAEGGWLVNGQKVWTSGAHTADWGYALVRTNPEVPKRAGITVMMIDMRTAGVEIRPLRQITGDAHFNEVFLSDVFVPDADVIGEVDRGWSIARATMGNERMVIGSTITHVSPDALLRLTAARAAEGAPIRQDVGAVVAEHHALTMLDLRRAMRAVAGGEPGPEGNVTKLLGNELDQRLTEVAMRMLGPDAAAIDGDDSFWGYQFLFTRAYTLGGGTSEMSRNTIGERILGLPRDPGR
ncbi:MAG TPA: acyl-CoA dehydrogenase [Acidimicrobiales bacterium]|nr:acyl-CoA dehydrogenase [Acidimicrobiales bacterium]